MDRLLSKDDIQHIVGKPILFYVYDDLEHIDNYRDFFKGYNLILILYRTEKYVGHWVCIKKIGNKVMFFDSYGFKVDEELEWVPIHYHANLSRILYYSPFTIEYSQYKLQADREGVNDCGRWCALFLRYATDIDLFGRIFKIYQKVIDIDTLCVLLTDTL